MGARRTRAASSSALGGGSDASPMTPAMSAGTNTRPVAAGIQNTGTWKRCISQMPTDLTAPEETMKLAHSTAPRISETRRPSM